MQSDPKQIHANHIKHRKMPAFKTQLVLVLLLIGSESDASLLKQSQCRAIQTKTNADFDTIENCTNK